jgi:wyosine [tRNA(Phe)-imidazoG37] synthetase (radical SAM superfamily)
MEVERKEFHSSAAVFEAVQRRVSGTIARSEPVDYLTFVSDGEPTLDINLGKSIEALKALGIKIGVISNASLIWKSEVRDALMAADWVSLKIDTVSNGVWRRINRPHRSLSLDRILEGIASFSAGHKGDWTTETMLVRDVNDTDPEIRKIARFISALNPTISYLSIPTRPPAVMSAQPPEEKAVNRAYQIFREASIPVEYLIGYEGNAFASTGEAVSDLLGITSVHPMREDAVDRLLSRAGADWSLVDGLIAGGNLVKVEYGGAAFFLRRLPG